MSEATCGSDRAAGLDPDIAALIRATIAPMGKDSRDIIRELEADGWRFVGASGSHHHFKHPLKPGKVTLPHPRKDLHPTTTSRFIDRRACRPSGETMSG